MPPTLTPLLETNIQRGVVQWGESAFTCPALAEHGIGNVGIARPGPQYCVVRLRPAFSHLNICLSGSARYVVNGQWRKVSAGQAVLCPRLQPHGSESRGSTAWRMAWVVFADHAMRLPRFATDEARVVATDSGQWENALVGLHREAQGANESACVQAWATIIHQLVRRLVRSNDRQARLTAVWENVEADLARQWTAPELARLAGMSEVHLRRLCLQALRRTPLQQVAWLRTRHASFLLQTEAQTVESVAWTVGYASVSAFTAAFKRWQGRSPKG